MKANFGSFCDDFSISTRLQFKLDLPLERETVLHFFDRVRREYPTLCKFRRRSKGALILEEDAGTGETYHWLRIEPTGLRFGCYAPASTAAYGDYAKFLLEQAPFHLTLSDLDIDNVEVLYGFDMEYRGNHDQLVAETFFADHPFSAFVLGDDVVHAIDCQPYLGVTLTPECDIQAYVEVKGRTSAYEVRSGEYDQQLLSVFLRMRKYCDMAGPADLGKTHATLCKHADRIAAEKVVPILVNPLAQAIASRS